MTQNFFSALRFLVAALALVSLPATGFAANYFVNDTAVEEGLSARDANVATNLVKNAVSSRGSDTLVEDEFKADYVLQPRLMQLGENYILTVEKIRGRDVLFAAQTKIQRIEQLDRAARSVTAAAIDEPSAPQPPRRSIASVDEPTAAAPYQVVPPERTNGQTQAPQTIIIDSSSATTSSANDTNTVSGARTTGRAIDALPRERKLGYWTLGVGPFLPRRLESDSLMYGISGGHVWDLDPRASVKIIGEANFGSGAERARFINVATGGSFFFQESPDWSPYVTADIGYGFASTEDANAEGFSFGTGAGFQFFRTTETTLDLLLRYAVILDTIGEEGDPSVIGLRMAVNF